MEDSMTPNADALWADHEAQYSPLLKNLPTGSFPLRDVTGVCGDQACRLIGVFLPYLPPPPDHFELWAYIPEGAKNDEDIEIQLKLSEPALAVFNQIFDAILPGAKLSYVEKTNESPPANLKAMLPRM